MSGEQNRSALVQKAFEELEGLHRFMMTTTPPMLITIAAKAHEVIDKFVDRPQEEKEELKAFTVLHLGAPYMFDDTTRFKAEYSQNVSDMVDAFIEQRITDDMAQVQMAMSAAFMEVTIDHLRTPEGMQQFLEDRPSAGEMAAADGQFAAMREGLEYSSAARLRAYEQKMYDTYKKEIEGILDSHPPQPPLTGLDGPRPF